ncbi:hypothetical protein U1Q18_004261 [Sarracenia purpurea var. burkii]
MGFEDPVLLDDDDDEDDGGRKASSVSCSICLEVVADVGDRSWAKLQCGHRFHLAFNMKGAMQCPNCRKIEKGQWRYASGCRPLPEFNMDDWAHEEDLYDLSYSEMSFGVHWCPFSGLTRLHSSFDEGEISSTAYHDLLGQHAIFAEQTAVSSAATHPCPYFAYLGPIHPSSSSSGGSVSDGSNFNNQWNGPSVPSEMPTSYAFPAMDVRYPNWMGSADHTSIPSMTHRVARSNSDIQRSGSYMHPFLVSHSSAARVGSSIASSMIPPHPGSVARARDRVQALQAYFQQPSNSPSIRAPPPVISGARRPSSHRGMAQARAVASSSDHTGGFYFFPSASSGRNFQEAENHPPSNRFQTWERDNLTSFSPSQADRDSGWGAFHQGAGGPDTAMGFRQRHISERMPPQNRS